MSTAATEQSLGPTSQHERASRLKASLVEFVHSAQTSESAATCSLRTRTDHSTSTQDLVPALSLTHIHTPAHPTHTRLACGGNDDLDLDLDSGRPQIRLETSERARETHPRPRPAVCRPCHPCSSCRPCRPCPSTPPHHSTQSDEGAPQQAATLSSLACVLEAWRAIRIDPRDAMRAQHKGESERLASSQPHVHTCVVCARRVESRLRERNESEERARRATERWHSREEKTEPTHDAQAFKHANLQTSGPTALTPERIGPTAPPSQEQTQRQSSSSRALPVSGVSVYYPSVSHSPASVSSIDRSVDRPSVQQSVCAVRPPAAYGNTWTRGLARSWLLSIALVALDRSWSHSHWRSILLWRSEHCRSLPVNTLRATTQADALARARMLSPRRLSSRGYDCRR